MTVMSNESPAYQGFTDIVPPLLSKAWSWRI